MTSSTALLGCGWVSGSLIRPIVSFWVWGTVWGKIYEQPGSYSCDWGSHFTSHFRSFSSKFSSFGTIRFSAMGGMIWLSAMDAKISLKLSGGSENDDVKIKQIKYCKILRIFLLN